MTPVQAQQWQALLKGLRAVAHHADEAGLALPEPLPAWAAWITPVGRLSFPTGRIVGTLDRLEPLPGHDASRDDLSDSETGQQPPVRPTEPHSPPDGWWR